MSLQVFFEMIGLTEHKASSSEIMISALGGFLGILAIFMITRTFFDPDTTVMIVPSMGASAVLLFAAPHAPFSQPWNVIAGHILSAIVGVACWQWIPDLAVAAAASVGLAIGLMYFARCTHPPGGATALVAVIGSDSLHELGFGYVFQPILLNAVAILIIAVLFNGLFKWRRYPAQLHINKQPTSLEASKPAPISHEDFVYALDQIATIVDVTEDDLQKIYQLATKQHQSAAHEPVKIQPVPSPVKK